MSFFKNIKGSNLIISLVFHDTHTGVSPEDRVKISVIWECLRVQLLTLKAEKIVHVVKILCL